MASQHRLTGDGARVALATQLNPEYQPFHDRAGHKYWYPPCRGRRPSSTRRHRRLQDDLGVDEAAAEAILRLRSQVIELQSHIRRLEAELTAQYTSQHMRLARYREVYYEATWIDLEYMDDEE